MIDRYDISGDEYDITRLKDNKMNEESWWDTLWCLDEDVKELEEGGFKMSAELTYLNGVIACAMGKDYPSDIGCENHPLVEKLKIAREALENIVYPDILHIDSGGLRTIAEEALEKIED